MKKENDGYSKLLRSEEYLDEMSHEAGKGMLNGSDDGALYYWYEDGLDEVSRVADNVPLYVNEI